MSTSSHWIDSAPLPEFPAPGVNLEVDTIVIGGGLTGLTTAYLLKKAGKTVALIERGRLAQVDTGHTTAHLTAVADIRLHELIRNFGKETAREVWDAGMAAIDKIEAIVAEERIDCDFARQDGYLHAPRGEETNKQEQHLADLKREAGAAAEIGVYATFVEAVPFFGTPGVRFPNQARFHPLRYLSALAAKIGGDGCHVFENAEAEEITDEPLTVTTGGHRIRGRYLVLATHTPLQGNAGLLGALMFQTKLSLYTSYALSARVPEGTVPEALFWDTKETYDYLRVAQDAEGTHVIFGGEDHKTGQVHDTEKCFDNLEERLHRLLPEAVVTRRWSGPVIETNDGLPFIGESLESQFISTGFSGNGMTFGTLAGMMAVDAAFGRDNRWKTLFDAGRRKWIGGAWTYLKENKDYPYRLVKDWLTKGAREPLEALPKNSGKVLELDGKKVAASRDAGGEITVCSAVCPHLGCIVDWNDAEQTWDCPCHGSRFKPDGEVISGPAEAPLEKIATAEARS